MFTELLLTREFAPQQQQSMLSIMHQEATRLTTLINNFLDLQRMTEGQHPYAFELLNHDPLLREAVPMFSAVTT